MPRRARQKSEMGIYHVILRGVNRQEIFYDADGPIITGVSRYFIGKRKKYG